MGGADAEVSAITSSSTLPLSQIKPNKGQPRKKFDQQSLEDLSDSIKKNGVLQPILVRKKGANYEIVAGERRYQAAKLAGLEEIPVSIREISDDEVFQLALIENLQRSDLDPIEEALGYRKLIKDNGFTQEQLGKILSKSRSAIANSLRLLDLPQEVQDMMADGKLTAGHARAILAVAGEEGKLKLAQKVLEQGLSVRQTENLAPLFSGNNETGEKPKRELVPQSFKRAQRQLRLALDTNVKVKRVRNKNKVEIEFADEEELAQLVDRLSGGMEAL
ncbi:putative stage 0 sporulation protein J [Olsenella sp. DNF00959]|nr:putative stage 0 sporulation protein J [Olsenella sp. DNF00959]